MGEDLDMKENVEAFFNELKGDKHGRFLSWEHCYVRFQDAFALVGGKKEDEIDYDRLTLDLAFYLASWGMYRGSSFILQKDYLVHLPVVKELLKPKWKELNNCHTLGSADDSLFLKLMGVIEKHYAQVRALDGEGREWEDVVVSKTLITKILLGTLACTPAFDEYFMKGSQAAGCGLNFGQRTLGRLNGYINERRGEFLKLSKRIKTRDGRYSYPLMKLLDMNFWWKGNKIAWIKKAEKEAKKTADEKAAAANRK